MECGKCAEKRRAIRRLLEALGRMEVEFPPEVGAACAAAYESIEPVPLEELLPGLRGREAGRP